MALFKEKIRILSSLQPLFAKKEYKILLKESFLLLFTAMNQYISTNIQTINAPNRQISAKYYHPLCTSSFSFSTKQLQLLYDYTATIALLSAKNKKLLDPIKEILPFIHTSASKTTIKLAALIIADGVYEIEIKTGYQPKNALKFISAFSNECLPDFYYPLYLPDYLLGVFLLDNLPLHKNIRTLIDKINSQKKTVFQNVLFQFESGKITLESAYKKVPDETLWDNLFCKKNRSYLRSNVDGKYRDNSDYESINYSAIFNLHKLLSPFLNSNSIFVDFGCGAARLINIFSSVSEIRKLIGIEIDNKIFNNAHYNIKNNKFNLSDIELFQMDASNFNCELGTIFYFFHPFGKRTMSAVAKNILKSLKSNPREIIIVYYNPFHKESFSHFGEPIIKSKLDVPLYIWKINKSSCPL